MACIKVGLNVTETARVQEWLTVVKVLAPNYMAIATTKWKNKGLKSYNFNKLFSRYFL